MKPIRFFDSGFIGAQGNKITKDQLLYISTENKTLADEVNLNEAIFYDRTFLTPPAGIISDENSFTVYVNGINIEPSTCLVEQKEIGIVITFFPNLVGFNVESDDEITLIGKFK